MQVPAGHAICGVPLDENCPMTGIKVMVNVTYCGHSLQAEAELNRQGEWIGHCVVRESPSRGRSCCPPASDSDGGA